MSRMFARTNWLAFVHPDFSCSLSYDALALFFHSAKHSNFDQSMPREREFSAEYSSVDDLPLKWLNARASAKPSDGGRTKTAFCERVHNKGSLTLRYSLKSASTSTRLDSMSNHRSAS